MTPNRVHAAQEKVLTTSAYSPHKPSFIRWSKSSWNIPATALSSAICLANVPLALKKIFILCTPRGELEIRLPQEEPACLCVCVCVRLSFCSVSPLFQPIILQGERALNVIMLKPTQPLMLFHVSSQISLTRLSRQGSGFPQTTLSLFDPSDFVALFFFSLLPITDCLHNWFIEKMMESFALTSCWGWLIFTWAGVLSRTEWFPSFVLKTIIEIWF